MKRLTTIVVLCLLITAGSALANGVSRMTTDQIKQLEERIAKAPESKMQEYARDLFDAAKSSLAAATASAATGNEKEAQQKSELATLQFSAAEAKVAERELVEQVAVRRAEVKKLEQQLERYRQGEVN